MKLKLEKSIAVKKLVVLPKAKKDMSAIIKQAILNNKKKKPEIKPEVASQKEVEISPETISVSAPEPVVQKPAENPILTQKVNK
jgi:hypothetical protein